MAKQTKPITIDMWYGDTFTPKEYRADASFYPHGSFGYSYRGNIYNSEGKTIGDYAASDTSAIEENFLISFI